jgi:hexosaminidase
MAAPMLSLALMSLPATAASAVGATPPGYGWSLDEFQNFMPVPNGPLENGTSTLSIHPKLTVSINCSSPILVAAAVRYQGIMFAWGPGGAASSIEDDSAAEPPRGLNLVALHVEVGETDESAPQLGMDESYTLEVPATASGTATLRANSVWGALRGFESFSQLVEYEPVTNEYVLRKAPWTIVDEGPRMLHRGLMIDTARHWLPVDTIKRQINAVSYSKMNTIHWCGKAPRFLLNENCTGLAQIVGQL